MSLLYETFLLPVGRLHAVLPFELSSSFRASYVQVETNGTQLVLPPSFNRTLLMGPYSSSQGTTNSPGFNGTQSTLTSVPILSGISSRCNNNTAEFVCSSDNSYTTNPGECTCLRRRVADAMLQRTPTPLAISSGLFHPVRSPRRTVALETTRWTCTPSTRV